MLCIVGDDYEQNSLVNSVHVDDWPAEEAITTIRNSSFAKVMFSQVSVCPQGGVYTPWQAGTAPWADTPLPGQTPPPQQTATAVYGTHPTEMHSCCL